MVGPRWLRTRHGVGTGYQPERRAEPAEQELRIGIGEPVAGLREGRLEHARVAAGEARIRIPGRVPRRTRAATERHRDGAARGRCRREAYDPDDRLVVSGSDDLHRYGRSRDLARRVLHGELEPESLRGRLGRGHRRHRGLRGRRTLQGRRASGNLAPAPGANRTVRRQAAGSIQRERQPRMHHDSRRRDACHQVVASLDGQSRRPHGQAALVDERAGRDDRIRLAVHELRGGTQQQPRAMDVRHGGDVVRRGVQHRALPEYVAEVRDRRDATRELQLDDGQHARFATATAVAEVAGRPHDPIGLQVQAPGIVAGLDPQLAIVEFRPCGQTVAQLERAVAIRVEGHTRALRVELEVRRDRDPARAGAVDLEPTCVRVGVEVAHERRRRTDDDLPLQCLAAQRRGELAGDARLVIVDDATRAEADQRLGRLLAARSVDRARNQLATRTGDGVPDDLRGRLDHRRLEAADVFQRRLVGAGEAQPRRRRGGERVARGVCRQSRRRRADRQAQLTPRGQRRRDCVAVTEIEAQGVTRRDAARVVRVGEVDVDRAARRTGVGVDGRRAGRERRGQHVPRNLHDPQRAGEQLEGQRRD